MDARHDEPQVDSIPVERQKQWLDEVERLLRRLTNPDHQARRSAALELVPYWAAITDQDVSATGVATEQLVAVLGDPDERVGWAAARLLASHYGETGRSSLVNSLQHDDSTARRLALLALTTMPSKPATASLLRALNDPDPRVRQLVSSKFKPPLDGWTVRALLAVVEDSRRLEPEVSSLLRASAATAWPELMHALTDTQPMVRAAGAAALSGPVDREEALRLLSVSATDNDPRVRLAAVESLARLPPGLVSSRLVASLTDDDARVASAACGALAESATDSGASSAAWMSAVDKLLSTGVPTARRAAAELHAQILLRSEQTAPRSRVQEHSEEMLVTAASDQDVEVRRQAVEGLAVLAPAPLDVVVTLTQDSDQAVRARAFEALAASNSRDAEIVGAAVKGLADVEGIWQTAVAILSRVSTSGGTESARVARTGLKQLLTHGDPARRVAGVESMTLVTADDLSACAALLGDTDSHTAQSAALTLAHSGTPAAYELLMEEVGAPDPWIAAAATYGAANVHDSTFARTLIQSTYDDLPRVRGTAIRLLAVNDPYEGRQHADRMLDDSDASVRLSAQRAFENTAFLSAVGSRDIAVDSVSGSEPELDVGGADHDQAWEYALSFGRGSDGLLESYTLADELSAVAVQVMRSRSPEQGGPQRYLNSWLNAPDSDTALSPTEPLETEADYDLVVNIGAVSPRSLVINSQYNPVAQLMAGREAHVDIVVLSDDFEILDSRVVLPVPAAGDSPPCRLRVRTPTTPGVAQLRILALHDNNCLMSQVVRAGVGSGQGGSTAVIDYVLTAELAQLPALKPQELMLHSAVGQEGEIQLVTSGGGREFFSSTVNEERVRVAATVARNALLDVHFGIQGAQSQYDVRNARNYDDCVEDLKLLAQSGWTLYQNVIDNSTRRRELRQVLRDSSARLGRPARLQVVSGGPRVQAFPWQLVYDIPVTGHPPKWTTCPSLAEWFTGPLATPGTVCPYTHSENSLCPFGFWGLAYEVASPPSSRGARRALVVTAPSGSPTTIAAVSDELDALATRAHLSELSKRYTVVDRRSAAGLRESLDANAASILYFYCHGKRQAIRGGSSRPLLEVGRGDLIAPEDLAAWFDTWPTGGWTDPQPLVIMNGCHTSELTPDLLVDFVTTFGQVNAAGAIGTEIALTQAVASEAAEHLMEELASGHDVAAAVRTMRWSMLRKGNLMGLSYTPYCYGGLNFEPRDEG